MNEGPENGMIPFSSKSFPFNVEFGKNFNQHLINIHQFEDEKRAIGTWRLKTLTVASFESSEK